MRYNKELHRRRSIRLKDYDYSQAGAYFVTVCTWNRECLLGEVVENVGARSAVPVPRSAVPVPNKYGEIVKSEWLKTAEVRPNVELDEFVIMPNHIHGILVINGDCRGTVCGGTVLRAPTYEQFGCPVPGSLPTIIRSFKATVTKQINEIRNTPGRPVWQRNYYEHVIRDYDDLNRIREYIISNPPQWAEDENNPVNVKPVL